MRRAALQVCLVFVDNSGKELMPKITTSVLPVLLTIVKDGAQHHGEVFDDSWTLVYLALKIILKVVDFSLVSFMFSSLFFPFLSFPTFSLFRPFFFLSGLCTSQKKKGIALFRPLLIINFHI